MKSATWCLFFFLILLVFSCSVLETEDVPRFRMSRIQECVGELGAVFREGKVSTLIVLIVRILSFSIANTAARCHTSKTRILTPCNFFSRIFFIVIAAPSQSSYSV